MQVDFYQLTRDPAVRVAPDLAARTLAAGQRMLILSSGEPALSDLSEALWSHRPDSFLANGMVGSCDEEVQPILLSEGTEATNAAKYCLIADGVWRDLVDRFERIFFLFPPEATEGARNAWRALSARDGVTLGYWRQEGRKWRAGP